MVIARHLSTIRHADIIFVIKGCEMVEQGTHETLLASNDKGSDQRPGLSFSEH